MMVRLIAFSIISALLMRPADVMANATPEVKEITPPGVTRIELHHGSSVQIEAWGQCATIKNTLPKAAMLYIPVFYAEAWKEFIRTKRTNILIAPCE